MLSGLEGKEALRTEGRAFLEWEFTAFSCRLQRKKITFVRWFVLKEDLCSPGCPEACDVAQAGLIPLPLPLPPGYWVLGRKACATTPGKIHG